MFLARSYLRRTVVGVGVFLLSPIAAFGQPPVEWPSYGKDPGGTRYARIEEINRENVGRLEPAWTYRTGDVGLSGAFNDKAAFECTPIMVDGTVYLTTPVSNVIALDAETGEQRWRFDAGVNTNMRYSEITNRGVSTWVDSETKARRIFLGALDARLMCLDASTGKPVSAFGEDGVIDLTDGVTLRSRADYQVTSPPAIIGNIVVVGSSMGDNRGVKSEEGVVRAFDVRTGERIWSWDPIPRSEDAPFADTWRGDQALETGAANVWSIISVDSERDLVFLPTTSPSPDHYGGERFGANVYANSVVALRASSGEVAWHFQVVHHDLWDYDVPCQPVLSTLRRDGEEIPVVIQGTKMGHVFVLHRETGKPVFPVEERSVPQTTVPGEETSSTQPFPTAPPPLLDDLEWPIQPQGTESEWFRKQIENIRYEGRFTPPSVEGSLQFPSTSGGINWGGVAYDPETGVLVTNMNRVGLRVRLIERSRFIQESRDGLMRGETAPQVGTDYAMERYLFRLPNGLPATPPPWGVLTAVDMWKGEIKWTRPLGFYPRLQDDPKAKEWGAPMVGGAILTSTGLIFVAATVDDMFRAFDVDTGEELWAYKLPAGGQATPMTYRATEGGKQFVVICAGGHGKMGTTQGDYVVAFALP